MLRARNNAVVIYAGNPSGKERGGWSTEDGIKVHEGCCTKYGNKVRNVFTMGDGSEVRNGVRW